jgi:hypothetical protein
VVFGGLELIAIREAPLNSGYSSLMWLFGLLLFFGISSRRRGSFSGTIFKVLDKESEVITIDNKTLALAGRYILP